MGAESSESEVCSTRCREISHSSSDVRSGDVATTKGIERNPVIGDLAISIDSGY